MLVNVIVCYFKFKNGIKRSSFNALTGIKYTNLTIFDTIPNKRTEDIIFIVLQFKEKYILRG